ncbi:hypothetical protein ACKWTF_015938 [Chironomus riparius]
MFLKLLTIALLATIVASQLTADQQQEEERIFNIWLKKHGIEVPQNADFNKWKSNVIKQYRKIETHNSDFRKGVALFEREINHFSHMSPEEFKASLIGFDKPKDDYGLLPVVTADATKNLPDYWNWNDKGIVHKVQQQGGCGSCYVFATIGVIEAHACLYNNICEKLSEQEGLECSDTGCNAGKDEYIYTYTQQKSGATYGNYTYEAKQVNTCDAADSRPRVPGTKVTGWQRMPPDAETIRFYLYNNGPMYVIFDIHENFKEYKRGIYSFTEGPALGCHCVLLVGYGTENGVGYWIFKNSWGPGFGEGGYFRVKRGENIANTEAYYPSYPVLDAVTKA